MYSLSNAIGFVPPKFSAYYRSSRIDSLSERKKQTIPSDTPYKHNSQLKELCYGTLLRQPEKVRADYIIKAIDNSHNLADMMVFNTLKWSLISSHRLRKKLEQAWLDKLIAEPRLLSGFVMKIEAAKDLTELKEIINPSCTTNSTILSAWYNREWQLQADKEKTLPVDLKLLLQHDMEIVAKAPLNMLGQLSAKRLQQALFCATQQGPVAALLKLIKVGASLRQQNKQGYNLLQLACLHNNIPATVELLKHSTINPNHQASDKSTALYLACKTGNIELVHALLSCPRTDPNQSASKWQTPLFIASAMGYEAIVKRLLAHPLIAPNKATINRLTPLYIATQKGHTPVVRVLINHRSIKVHATLCKNPLKAAKKVGDKEIANLLSQRS